ncbi:hypothetical protein GQ54DRAFT_300925 [Martensiomyces pterosporus]|nr:hypothetical protein GQ54DRAFT_300925 [Martensiomyces pterosporus]
MPPSTPTPLPRLSGCARVIDSHECFAAAPHAWSAAELPKSDNQSASARLSTPTTPSDLAREALSS